MPTPTTFTTLEELISRIADHMTTNGAGENTGARTQELLQEMVLSLQAILGTLPPEAISEFPAWDISTTYIGGQNVIVTYSGKLWLFVSPTNNTGTVPGTYATIWRELQAIQLAHQRNQDQYLDLDGPYQSSAQEIREHLDAPPPSGTGTWGGIDGDINDQMDLAARLADKANTADLGTAAAADIGAFDGAGVASSAISAHVGAADPHGDRAYATSYLAGKMRKAMGMGVWTWTNGTPGANNVKITGSQIFVSANAYPGDFTPYFATLNGQSILVLVRGTDSGACWLYGGTVTIVAGNLVVNTPVGYLAMVPMTEGEDATVMILADPLSSGGGGGGGSVDSVNGQTGVVVLDQDDVLDGTTYKQYSLADKNKVAALGTASTHADTDFDAAGAASAAVSAHEGLTDPHPQYQKESEKGQPNGYASLDASSQIPAAQIPAIAITEYLGAVASEAAMLALTGQHGDWCTRSDLGTSWIITGADPSILAGWTALSYPASPVTTVAGRVGNVIIVAADLADFASTARSVALTGLSTATGGAVTATDTVLVAFGKHEKRIALNDAKVTNATHTGDVTGSTALTIGANKVTNAKMATMAANTIKGNNTGSTANAVDMTVAEAQALLHIDKRTINAQAGTTYTLALTDFAAGALINATGSAELVVTIPLQSSVAIQPGMVCEGTVTGTGAYVTFSFGGGITVASTGDVYSTGGKGSFWSIVCVAANAYVLAIGADLASKANISGATTISVVSSLPGTPDANTLYFITT